jgi:hypothetical protein
MNRTELTQKIKAAASQTLAAKGYISAVDLLMTMGRLTQTNYERWRSRQSPCLETVLTGNLSQHHFLLRTLRSHALYDLQLKPSRTVYTSQGKGLRRPLQFSKQGNTYIEELYSTHYLGCKLTTAKPKHQGGALDSGPELKSSPASNLIQSPFRS